MSSIEMIHTQENDFTRAGLHINPNLLRESSAPESSLSESTIWNESLLQIGKQLDEQLFAAWIKPLRLEKIQLVTQDQSPDKCAIVDILAPNKFSTEHVKQHYSELVATILAEVTGSDNVVLRFKVESREQVPLGNKGQVGRELAVSRSTSEGKEKPHHPRKSSDFGNLNSKYRFQNFVVGACNQFAHAVSMRVSEQLGSNYNPLFIYGGVGLGKTHLANAIGNASIAKGKKVVYLSSETFVNELISALRTNRMQDFKNKFRSLDLLIVDDIQFIIGKERSQEEFFHTFNALHNKRSQIIVTSDKIPQQLTGLEERLRTRFSSGISVDLLVPDFETRVAILAKKAEAESFPLSLEVAQLLAEKIDSNVRELEGALNRLQAFSSLQNAPVTLELAESALRNIIPEKKREITIELIQKTVADKYRLSFKDLIGKRRTQQISTPRHVAMYLCRKLTTCSYPEIGTLFGGRDHSTVIHATKVVRERMADNVPFKNDLETLEKRLKG